MTLVDADTGEIVRLDVYQARFSGLIHPAADRYPRMKQGPLGDLAVDIAENGQLEPIWVDAEGTLLDGRNRLAACQMVGVEPHFAMYTGEDIDAFIVSKNEHRRHLSQKEQKDLRQKRIAELREKGMSTRAIAEDVGVSKSQVDRDESQVSRDGTPEITGTDGKVYGAWSDQKNADFLAAYDAAERNGKALVAQGYGLTSKQAAQRADRLRRRSRDEVPPVVTKTEKIERIVELAPSGLSAKQIGDAVDLTETTVRVYAKEAGVEIAAEKLMGRVRRIDPDRVIQSLVDKALYDIESDSALAVVRLEDLDRERLPEWVSSLSASIKSLTTLRNRLNKELTRG